MYKDNIKDIEKVITNYFEGIFYGQVDKLASCFTDNVFVYGDINGVPYKKSVIEYLEGVKERKSPNDLNETFKMEVVGIDIIGNVAMVKLRVPMLGYNYYDYLSLTKVNDNWKIVSKIFTHVA
ncbi:nuclear transport factor 2 family protein [Aquimarina sp. MMG015]|uniref:nuclear transport factor 2 family protein n=1 Tax=Aquimarina TaxID=290174 RepID=UPI000420E327|nr:MULTISPECIES: nuclear transport factor 2 family protein [Aquimarina]MBQ4804659.1 nuclear transport factor 2 family protein [Aquimarina sp. MMG015]